MTPDDTAALLVLASGGLGNLVRPLLRWVAPGRKWGPKTVQPFTLAAVAALVVGWHALQPGPMDWAAALTQAGLAWVLANGRVIANATTRKKKSEVPEP